MGGDHALAVGSIAAVARHCRDTGKKLRVLWLDAHADFNTNTLTPSGNIHGMPVACLCGLGPRALTELAGHTPAPIRGKPRQQEALQELCRTVITEACAAGERPLVLFHSTTSVNLWKWLADIRIDPDHIDFDALGNGLGYEQLWKEARIVRVRVVTRHRW